VRFEAQGEREEINLVILESWKNVSNSANISGLMLSKATEWKSNVEKNEYQKQDCAREAFKRMAIKLKKFFPRLSKVCLMANELSDKKFLLLN